MVVGAVQGMASTWTTCGIAVAKGQEVFLVSELSPEYDSSSFETVFGSGADDPFSL